MNKKMKYAWRNILFLLLSMMSFSLFTCGEKGKIIALQETHIMELPEDIIGNKIIDTLQTGEECKILDVTYSKDYAFYKVETKGGKIGFILGDSRQIKRVQ